MVSRENIEEFLDRLSADGASYREVERNLWVVRPAGSLGLDVVVSYAPPVVIVRVKVMDTPADDARGATLNRRLLELNATDLVHGSYGIEGQAIVLTEALELSHLDYEEFRASYESMTLALAAHLRELSEYRGDAAHVALLRTGEHTAAAHAAAQSPEAR
jgi:Tir chaperone family protein CesT